MKAKKVKASITLEKNVLDRARLEADKYKRSLSQFTNVILKHYLSSKDKSRLFEEEN